LAPRKPTGSYQLIARGPDGRPRVERFDSVAEYRARLATLHQSQHASISIDDLLGLLES